MHNLWFSQNQYIRKLKVKLKLNKRHSISEGHRHLDLFKSAHTPELSVSVNQSVIRCPNFLQ